MEMAHRRTQRLSGGRIVDRFQPATRVGGEFFVGQEIGQRGHGLLVAQNGQLLAGPGLVEGCCVGPQHANQACGLRGTRSGCGRGRDGLGRQDCRGELARNMPVMMNVIERWKYFMAMFLGYGGQMRERL